MTNLAPARRTSGLLSFLLCVAVSGCVDTAEPTGPVPTPEPDPGELTTVVRSADPTASVTGQPVARSPITASAAGS